MISSKLIHCTLMIAVGLLLSACETLSTATSTLPNAFTTENIMKTQQGMSSEEILKMYGTPKSVSQAVCGDKKPWTCTTWEYGEFPYDRATFTFSGNAENKTLNDFKIERK